MQENTPKTCRPRCGAGKGTVLLLLVFMLVACGSKKNIYDINLMPAPDIFQKDIVNPFIDHDPISSIPQL
jgi:hypothetical protein